jgi:hypothetical protein
LHRAGTANPLEFPLLQNAEKLCLQAGRDVADLIQKYRSMVGCLEAAQALRNGTGEGALLMAKEFTLEQAFGYRGAVYADEWAAAPWAELVNQAGEHFLPCTRLSIDNDGGIRRGDDPRLS